MKSKRNVNDPVSSVYLSEPPICSTVITNYECCYSVNRFINNESNICERTHQFINDKIFTFDEILNPLLIVLKYYIREDIINIDLSDITCIISLYCFPAHCEDTLEGVKHSIAYYFDSLVIDSNWEFDDWTMYQGQRLIIYVRNTCLIESEASISVSYRGYWGPRGNSREDPHDYIDDLDDLDARYLCCGAGGGSFGGAGGGVIKIFANKFINKGVIESNGGWGRMGTARGGSGGNIWIRCNMFRNIGSIKAEGGQQEYGGGGYGLNGNIHIDIISKNKSVKSSGYVDNDKIKHLRCQNLGTLIP